MIGDPFATAVPLPEAPPAPPPEAGRPRAVALYRRAGAIHEIEASPVLQWLYGALLLGYYITFHIWLNDAAVAVETAEAGAHTCWPYFHGCGDVYFLSALPVGYSQSLFYAGHFALLLAAAAAVWRRNWTLAHLLMLPAFLWKAVAILLLSKQLHANYHTYHLILSFLLLFGRHKLFFLRRTFVLLYFLASTVKLHDGWILGTYFTTLVTGLPLFPDALAPVCTLALILVEMIGSWLLLSRRRGLQLVMIALFTGFHLYSIVLVGFLYPTMCLPPLLILFLPRVEPAPAPLTARALPGWTLIALLLGLQALPVLIPGDEKLTMEGNFYGLFMFEANHQCASETSLQAPPDPPLTLRWASDRAMVRCDPYNEWFRIQQLCARAPGTRVAWTYDHAINGGPLYRIVDEPDACALDYAALAHNPWIRTPDDGAVIVGRSVRNYFPAAGRAPPPPDQPPTLGGLQQALAPHASTIARGLQMVALGVLAMVALLGLVRVRRASAAHRHRRQ